MVLISEKTIPQLESRNINKEVNIHLHVCMNFFLKIDKEIILALNTCLHHK